MRNLLNFLFNYGYWILFLLLEAICFTLLFRFNSYQGSVGFTTANRIVGQVHSFSAEISSFFNLHTINAQLTQHNVQLQAENVVLRKALETAISNGSAEKLPQLLPQTSFTTIPAKVIQNSLNLPDNYITLDKGSADGVTTEMGVVNGNGILGIIYLTSEHYSLAISLLNSKSSISCKFKQNDYFGYLKWKGGDSNHAYLEDLPRHAIFQKGDTIVTSGYSAVFPKGLMVGTVDRIADSKDGLSYLLRINLSTDFANLDDALIISNNHQDELRILKDAVKKSTK